MRKQVYFGDYMKNSKKLMVELFGKDLVKQLEKTPLKSIEWEGVDVYSASILAGFPNIKERFNKEFIEWAKENGDLTPLDLFLQVVFHYGYQQCTDIDVEPANMRAEMCSFIFDNCVKKALKTNIKGNNQKKE